MMRRLALVLASAIAVVACSPTSCSSPTAKNGETPSTSTSTADNGGLSSIFPNLFSASYRAEGVMYGDNGREVPFVMIRSGAKSRMEMNAPDGHMVMISDLNTHEALSLVERGGRTMAIRMDLSGVPQVSDPAVMMQAEARNVSAGGPCLQAGQTGSIWNVTKDGATNSACVTSDGIMLWAKKGDRIVWQTNSVQRGPQDQAQFAPPPGVQVMDLGNLGARAAAMAAAAKGVQDGH